MLLLSAFSLVPKCLLWIISGHAPEYISAWSASLKCFTCLHALVYIWYCMWVSALSAVYLMVWWCLSSDQKMWDALQERHTETAETDGVIRDVYDGAHYQKHASFLSQPANISLLINTDGIAIFQSSKASLWPVWVMINELPKRLRLHAVVLILTSCPSSNFHCLHVYCRWWLQVMKAGGVRAWELFYNVRQFSVLYIILAMYLQLDKSERKLPSCW